MLSSEDIKEKEKEKEKTMNKMKRNINKQTTNQKHRTTTEDMIPTHKQQNIKEKLTLQNTKYIYIAQTTQEQPTLSKIKIKKIFLKWKM